MHAGNNCDGEKQQVRTQQQQQRRRLLLDRFEKGELLGAGSFACVYHARRASTGEEVAIKVVEKIKIVRSELSREHVKREIAALRRLRHPNVVRLFDVMASKAKIYIVMEYVRGGDLLRKVSAEGALGEAAARKLFQQLISAVRFCHGRGVYHRDIKLENLLVDEKGDLKLADFGLSAVAGQKRAAAAVFHTMCGTLAYVAPEVLAHRAYEAARADVWSCGVVLFGLRAGRLPFQDSNPKLMCHKICKGQVRYPNSFSPDLTRLLRRILTPDPTKRITISEIMETPWFRRDFRPEVKSFYDRCGGFDDVIDCALPLTPSDERAPTRWELLKSECSSSLASSSSSSSSWTNTPTTPLPSSPFDSSRRPAQLNAFDIIAFSPWLKLSGMFEDGGCERQYTSSADAREIVSRLEEIAGSAGFTARTRDFTVSIEGREGEEEEPLWIVAEVTELAPDVAVVLVVKKGGDVEEFEVFCNNKLSPGLRSLKGSACAVENAATGSS